MKTILVTGATSGFGKATAELLAKDGHRLLLVARRGEELEALKSSLKTDVHIATLDITNRDKVADFFDSLPSDFRDIDVLVNNAGLARGMDPAQDASLDDWQQMVDTNIMGLLYMTRQVLEIMKQRGAGLIINLGSVAAHVPYKGGNVYGATKAFVAQFSRGLRTDVFGTNIKVTNIEPGAAATGFAGVRFDDEQKGQEFYSGWQPLTSQDIAATIDWVIQQPAHVNIDNVEIMALQQTSAGMVIDRSK